MKTLIHTNEKSYRDIYVADKSVSKIFENYLESNKDVTKLLDEINPKPKYGPNNFKQALQDVLEIVELPICFIKIRYTKGSQSPHICCKELCDLHGKKLKVDSNISAKLRRLTKMYQIETYCFKNNTNINVQKEISSEYLSKKDEYDEKIRNYKPSLHVNTVQFSEVEDTTEYIIIDFLNSLPDNNSPNFGPLSTESTCIICIKMDTDIV